MIFLICQMLPDIGQLLAVHVSEVQAANHSLIEIKIQRPYSL